jgi:hypothetical protein
MGSKKDKTWQKANETEGMPCSQCGAPLHALYNVTLSAPWPWDNVGFTKGTIKTTKVGIVAASWDTAQPFCASCGHRDEDHREAAKSEVILRLMRELIIRGASPSEVQKLVGSSTSSIDVLAATYPKIAQDSGRNPAAR